MTLFALLMCMCHMHRLPAHNPGTINWGSEFLTKPQIIYIDVQNTLQHVYIYPLSAFCS